LIFATVGTHHQPFARFLHVAVEIAAGRELVIQHGHTPRVPAGPSVRWHQWLAPNEVSRFMREAELVITHAGVASLVDAIRAGQRPVVVARRAHLGEHVDDHQLQIVAALERLGLVSPLGVETPPSFEAPVAALGDWPPSGLKAVINP
jgi:UDP-N-acetylglucosamine transferase subunit ALG13